MYNIVQLSKTYVLVGPVVLRKENDWVPLPGGETPTVGKTGLKNTLQTIQRQPVALHMFKLEVKSFQLTTHFNKYLLLICAS